MRSPMPGHVRPVQDGQTARAVREAVPQGPGVWPRLQGHLLSVPALLHQLSEQVSAPLLHPLSEQVSAPLFHPLSE